MGTVKTERGRLEGAKHQLTIECLLLIVVLFSACTTGKQATPNPSPTLSRSGNPPESPSTLPSLAVPSNYADGSKIEQAPDFLRSAYAVPVLIAKPIEKSHAAVTECSKKFEREYRTVWAVLLPEGASVVFTSSNHDYFFACGEYLTDQWRPCPLGTAPVSSSEDELARKGRFAQLCFRSGEDKSPTGYLFAIPPPKTAWIVQERGQYRLAYQTDPDLIFWPAVPNSDPKGNVQTVVEFLSASGTKIGQAKLSGFSAG